MTQSLAITKKFSIPRTEVIKMGSLDVESRIQQFHLTVIGIVWNPRFQKMDSLLHNLPKIWKLENKVFGSDLGFGKFHFNFESEEDIEEVIKSGPYHYDSWMVSVVRWEPIIAKDYPSAISFWIRIRDIPFQFWAEPILRAVGKAISFVLDVDEETGSARVTINGFSQLEFKTIIPFDSGEEIDVVIKPISDGNIVPSMEDEDLLLEDGQFDKDGLDTNGLLEVSDYMEDNAALAC